MASPIEARRRPLAHDAGTISCLEWPRNGAPPLLFSHATGFNALTYNSLLAPLAGGFCAAAIDYRGHGFTTLTVEPGLATGWTIFCSDLAAALSQLTSKPAILVGHSMGANVSLMVAALAPSLVRALLLIEPVLLEPMIPFAPNRLAVRAAQRRNLFPSIDAALEAYRGRGVFASWPETVLHNYLAGGLLPNTDGTLRLACPPEWEAEIYREAPIDIARLAGKISCPLSLMHGTIESTASRCQLDAIRALKPESRIVAVEGASHFLPIEKPHLVREEIISIRERTSQLRV